MKSVTLKIRPFAFIKSRYNFRTVIKDQFDQTKQLNATMPNLIHSLDASSIALLYNLLAKCDIANIYTVHDCFAVTADNVDLLISLLKSVYMTIYSDNVYLKNLDTHVKNTIISTLGVVTIKEIDGKSYVIIERDNNEQDKIFFPSVDDVIDMSTSIKGVVDSSYLIS